MPSLAQADYGSLGDALYHESAQIVSVGGDGGLRNVEVIVLGNCRFQIEAIRFSSGDEDETVSSPGSTAAFPPHFRRLDRFPHRTIASAHSNQTAEVT